ncbi:MAG: dotD [Gammaproteobacteria bacterium]|jgi:defect-in-organelle-trafficking protein DotD|nr:dotD [Gammaproteobacteria bacterium]
MKRQYVTLLAFITAAITLLSGCSNRPPSTNIYYPTDSASENAQNKLAEAAVSTSSSLTRLAAIEKATHPSGKLSPPMSVDQMNRVGLGALTSIDWTGPIEPLVKELARISHYKFRVLGKRPAIPVLVATYAVNMPVGDILRDADYQAGNKADVIIYTNHRTIELRYRHGDMGSRGHVRWK